MHKWLACFGQKKKKKLLACNLEYVKETILQTQISFEKFTGNYHLLNTLLKGCYVLLHVHIICLIKLKYYSYEIPCFNYSHRLSYRAK